MKNFLSVLKEVGIVLLIIVIVVGGVLFVFKDKVPLDVDVPLVAKYETIDKSKYPVVGDIQDAQNETEIYEASMNELDQSQTEVRYVPGSINPFVGDTSTTDLPFDVISQNSGDIASTESDNSSGT